MRVLVGLDGSPSCLAGLDALTVRVWPSDTRVKLVTVVPPPETNFLGLSLAHSYREEKQEMDSAERMLTSHAHFYQRKTQNATMEVEVLTGRPKEALLQIADDWKPDLFILGSRGQRDFDPLMLGSVSQAVLEHAPCAVQIARPRDAQQHDRMNILLPVDHSPFSMAALDWLLTQRWPESTRVRLMSVVPRLTYSFEHEDNTERAGKMLAAHHEMEDSAMALLQKCSAKLNPVFGSVTCEVMSGEARDTILTSAEQWPADLIVMGSHGLSGIQRFLLGSVSRSVSVHAKCSVEIVRRQS